MFLYDFEVVVIRFRTFSFEIVTLISVTSESFIKRICSYDGAQLRQRPSPNDALRRLATRDKLAQSGGLGGGLGGGGGMGMGGRGGKMGGPAGMKGGKNGVVSGGFLELLQPVATWNFAVKCMKKAAFKGI